MPVTGVAFVMYPVTDMRRAIAFYRDALGLAQTEPVGEAGHSNQWVEFHVPGTTFGIGNFEQAGTPGSAQLLALEVNDLPEFRRTLADRDVESSEPYETPICWISAITDPDGNRVYLHQARVR